MKRTLLRFICLGKHIRLSFHIVVAFLCFLSFIHTFKK